MLPNFIKNIFRRNLAVSDQWLVKMQQPIYTNWTLQKAVAEGYKINGWVYRSVFLIAKAISQVGWYVINDDGEPLPKHYLSDLLNKPNPNISRQDMFELVTSWLELAGNSYLKKVKVGSRTAELWPISPDRLAPIPSKQIDEWIKGYALDQKRTVEFEPEEIIHHKFFNPANPLIGIAPLQAAAKTVDVDNGQQDWNKAAMQNRGVVDGVMAFDRNFDTQDQVDKISERLNESAAGPKNARKIKVVGSNAKYTRMGLTAVEMDFGESRKFNRDEIFIIFGIPPAYGGSQEASTYNNYLVSELIFWFQTAIPLLDDLKDTFNLSFRDELKDNEHIGYDLSMIPALKRAMVEWTEISKNLFEMGVPFDQINRIFEYGFQEFDGWDKSHVKNTAAVPVEKREKTENKYTLLNKRSAASDKKEIAKLAEGPVKDIIFNLLDKQKDEVFKNLSESNIKKVIAASVSSWEEEFQKIYLDVGVRFGADIVVEKRGIEEDTAAEMEKYLENEKIILTEISEINETTVDKLLLQVAEGTKEGYAIGQIQQAIIDTGIFSPERALLIGRTEVGTAANLGQLVSATVSGATHKTWSTATFEVRDSHKKMNGVKVKIDENFNVGGEKARYPLDNNLSPAEKCNCFLPGTEIYGSVSKGMMSIYNGEAVEIVVDNGLKVRVSKNHPILTNHGVVPAGSIQNGDKLVTNKINIKRPVIDMGLLAIEPPDKNDSPSLVENIFSTLSLIGLPEHRRATPIDFHGDGTRIESNIDIIRTDRVLLENLETSISKRSRKVVLKKEFSGLINKSVDGSFLLGFSGVFAPSSFFPCSGKLPVNTGLISFDFIPFEFFGITPGSQFNIGLFKDSINRLTGDIIHIRKFFDADTADILFNYFKLNGFNLLVSLINTLPVFCPEGDTNGMNNFIDVVAMDTVNLSNVCNSLTGDVAINNVLSVNHFDYSGPVYDVESPNGWVFANGILSSNCRCTLTYSIED